MGCKPCGRRLSRAEASAERGVIFTVTNPDGGVESFDPMLTGDAYDLARAKARETGGRVSSTVVAR